MSFFFNHFLSVSVMNDPKDFIQSPIDESGISMPFNCMLINNENSIDESDDFYFHQYCDDPWLNNVHFDLQKNEYSIQETKKSNEQNVEPSQGHQIDNDTGQTFQSDANANEISPNDIQKTTDDDDSTNISSNTAIEPTRSAHSDHPRGFKLSDEGNSFKNEYYQSILKGQKKKFEKIYVKQIHNCFIASELGVKLILRDEFRSINKYFEDYLPYKDKILDFISRNRYEIISKLRIAVV